MIRRQFEVSVWSQRESRWIPFGRHGETKVAELESKGWRIKKNVVDLVDTERAAQLQELAAMERDVESAVRLPASERSVLRKALRAHRAKVLGRVSL